MKAFVWCVLLFGIFSFQQELYAGKPNTLEKKTHLFSNPTLVDTFKLFYNSADLRDTIWLEIISSNGDLIYQVKFSGLSLFDYGKPSYMYYADKGWKAKNYYLNVPDSIFKTDSLKNEDDRYLRSKIANFFDDKKFIRNPIPEMLKENKKNLIAGSYETLLNDPDVIGFFYHLDEEDGRMIAYSRKKNKVIHFWGCC